MGNIHVKFMKFRPVYQEEMMSKDISYLVLWWPFFQRSRNICAMLVEDIMRNNSVNLFQI